MFATVTGTPLYIVHTSSALALETGLSLRKSGSRIFLETCPHYLTHDVIRDCENLDIGAPSW